eukprot:15458269-Alexandrium_andersonii.AAC.1
MHVPRSSAKSRRCWRGSCTGPSGVARPLSARPCGLCPPRPAGSAGGANAVGQSIGSQPQRVPVDGCFGAGARGGSSVQGSNQSVLSAPEIESVEPADAPLPGNDLPVGPELADAVVQAGPEVGPPPTD